jgi:hypothetical protein
MKEKATIEFTKQEAEVLFNVIHVAVKTAGLEGNTADNALYFRNKINAAFAPETPKQGRDKALKKAK